MIAWEVSILGELVVETPEVLDKDDRASVCGILHRLVQSA